MLCVLLDSKYITKLDRPVKKYFPKYGRDRKDTEKDTQH